MDLEFAFLASAAEASPGGKFNVLGGGVNLIESPTFPCVLQAALVLRVAAPSPEADEEHKVIILLSQPDGTRAKVVDRPLVIRSRQFPTSAVVLVVQLAGQLPGPGDYGLVVLLDDVERKVLPLYVRLKHE